MSIAIRSNVIHPPSRAEAVEWRRQEWHRTLDWTAVAMTRLVAGDAVPFRALWSSSADTSFFDASGEWAVGSANVDRQLDWVGMRCPGGRLEVYSLAEGCSEDLAYSMQIEDLTPGTGPSAGTTTRTYRSTHVYQWEDDAWRIVHRHADRLDASRARSIRMHPSTRRPSGS